MVKQYDDFELLIDSAGDHYRVTADSPAGQVSGEFEIPFTQVELDNFYQRIGQMRRSVRGAVSPDLEAARRFGNKLFRSVFTGELLGQLRICQNRSDLLDRGLRLRLRLKGAPALAELPWEFLYDQDLNHFLATSSTTPIVRHLDLPQGIRPLAVNLPLRILVVICGPRNLQPLDSNDEWKRLKISFQNAEKGRLIVPELLEGATLEALRKRVSQAPFHILHFIGHGRYDPIAEDGVLYFEDAHQMPDPVPGRILGNILRGHRTLRLAVLNACDGARQSAEDPFSGVAQSLCQQTLPAVVAMQFEISDDAAKTFAEEFYAALANGSPVDAALGNSRQALYSKRMGQEWATPVLYMRSPDGTLFDVTQAPDAKPVHFKPSRRQLIAASSLAAAGTLVAAGVAKWEKVWPFSSAGPSVKNDSNSLPRPVSGSASGSVNSPPSKLVSNSQETPVDIHADTAGEEPRTSTGGAAESGFAGLDTPIFPGVAAMNHLKENTNLRWCGYYLARSPSHRDSSWMGQREALQKAGWGLAPVFVGRQSVGVGSLNPSKTTGTEDAKLAVQLMETEGFDQASCVYLDMENGPPFVDALKDYVTSWSEIVWNQGFHPGVYCSHLLASQLHLAAAKFRIWTFKISGLTCQRFDRTYPAPDPAGSGYPGAYIWQYAQECNLASLPALPQGISGDLNSALTPDPGAP